MVSPAVEGGKYPNILNQAKTRKYAVALQDRSIPYFSSHHKSNHKPEDTASQRVWCVVTVIVQLPNKNQFIYPPNELDVFGLLENSI